MDINLVFILQVVVLYSSGLLYNDILHPDCTDELTIAQLSVHLENELIS